MDFGSYKTAWNWLHKLRAISVFPDGVKLSGNVKEVAVQKVNY